MDIESARDLLIRHARAPLNLVQEGFALGHFGECRNPVCGDHVRIWLDLAKEEIRTCRILPKGCTMCLASASLMSERLQGESIMTAQSLPRLFEDALIGDQLWPPEISTLSAFEHLRVNRARIPCALIAWHAFGKALRL